MHMSMNWHPEPGAAMRSSVHPCLHSWSVTLEVDHATVTVFLDFGDLDRFAEVLRSTAEQIEAVADARQREHVEAALESLRADADRMAAR